MTGPNTASTPGRSQVDARLAQPNRRDRSVGDVTPESDEHIPAQLADVTPVSRAKRRSVELASAGNSLLISGVPGSGVSTTLEETAAALGDGRVLVRLVGTRLGESEPYLALEPLLRTAPAPEAHPATVLDQIRGAFAALPGHSQPVLVIDLVEHLDPASVQTLGFLVRAGEAQVLLGTHRHRKHPELVGLIRSGVLTLVTLHALSDEERDAVIRPLVPGWVAPSALTLLAGSEPGNPMLLRARVTHAIASGAIVRSRGLWVPSGLPLTDPPQITELVDAWLTQLLPEEVELLAAAAGPAGIELDAVMEQRWEDAADALLGLGLLRYGRSGEARLRHTMRSVEERMLPADPPTPGDTRITAAGVLTARGDWAASEGLLDHEAALPLSGVWLRTLNAWHRGDPNLLLSRVEEALRSATEPVSLQEAPETSAWTRLLCLSLLSRRNDQPELLNQLLTDSEASPDPAGPTSPLSLAARGAALAIALVYRGAHGELLDAFPETDPPKIEQTDVRVRLARQVIAAAQAVSLAAGGRLDDALARLPETVSRRGNIRDEPLRDQLFWAGIEVRCIAGDWPGAARELSGYRRRIPAFQAVQGGLCDLVEAGLLGLQQRPSEMRHLAVGALAQLERHDPHGVLPYAWELLGVDPAGQLDRIRYRTRADGSLYLSGIGVFFDLSTAMSLPDPERGQRLADLSAALEHAGMTGSLGPVLLAELASIVALAPDRSHLLARSETLRARARVVWGGGGTAGAILRDLIPALEAGNATAAIAAAERASERGWPWFLEAVRGWAEAADPSAAPRLNRLPRGLTEAAGLTARETEVADRAASGRSSREIGAELGIAQRTVDTHLLRVFRKLGIRSRAELRECSRNTDALGAGS